MADFLTLELVRERKLGDLLPQSNAAERWEASSVLVKDGHFVVVFDDRAEFARISEDLQFNKTNTLLGTASSDCGYEGITYNLTRQRYYLLIESRKHAKGCYKASIVEYDDGFA